MEAPPQPRLSQLAGRLCPQQASGPGDAPPLLRPRASGPPRPQPWSEGAPAAPQLTWGQVGEEQAERQQQKAGHPHGAGGRAAGMPRARGELPGGWLTGCQEPGVTLFIGQGLRNRPGPPRGGVTGQRDSNPGPSRRERPARRVGVPLRPAAAGSRSRPAGLCRGPLGPVPLWFLARQLRRRFWLIALERPLAGGLGEPAGKGPRAAVGLRRPPHRAGCPASPPGTLPPGKSQASRAALNLQRSFHQAQGLLVSLPLH